MDPVAVPCSDLRSVDRDLDASESLDGGGAVEDGFSVAFFCFFSLSVGGLGLSVVFERSCFSFVAERSLLSLEADMAQPVR